MQLQWLTTSSSWLAVTAYDQPIMRSSNQLVHTCTYTACIVFQPIEIQMSCIYSQEQVVDDCSVQRCTHDWTTATSYMTTTIQRLLAVNQPQRGTLQPASVHAIVNGRSPGQNYFGLLKQPVFLIAIANIIHQLQTPARVKLKKTDQVHIAKLYYGNFHSKFQSSREQLSMYLLYSLTVTECCNVFKLQFSQTDWPTGNRHNIIAHVHHTHMHSACSTTHYVSDNVVHTSKSTTL